ncbi:sugar phosphate isomerase/epimerase family protein [Chitinophaga ginsengisegetis]|uniref:sugar phosphate isomerase/epimerase family protein n=1 Tax=Chitinophaga ginsengisegetis TaxID=393003 RepID=UPI000DBA60BD|nr:sugar phosphate isomerase/epimerase [Chitinophaga ginsengisegetis]MDR6568605.1 sugar phosphate isomerase/epimerase [Chitinophaga ginsengisegetis]MDR6648164.1 sugar phosphate isomerase/epimerase [Chitinophaga ginsengisegetis]MDR6654686.1 sugar phosphate isomerase/epimerase [Chitinophaga ginsengisegetis]
MSISRRNFLLKGSLAIAGTALLSKDLLAATVRKPVLGIQLYSIRDDMKKDPSGTLKQLAAMGYKNVEHAGYSKRQFYGYSAKEFKKLLDDLGLLMPSGHTVMGKQHWDAAKNDFTDEWKYTVEDAAIVGQHYVISPWLDESLRKNYDDFKAYMDVFNKSGALCKKSGMKFGYHNHDFEFSQQLNGQKIFDLILQNTDPSLVAQQLDIGNMYHAGGIALDIIKQYPGRFELMHVKDEIKTDKGEMGGKYESTVLGKGIIPVKEVIDLGKKSGGTRHFIIEQESYQGQAPLDAVRDDLAVMKKWGY